MTRTAALRLSLLVSLGLVPLACGGEAQRNDGDDDSAGKTSGAGSGGSGPGMTSSGSGNKPTTTAGSAGSGALPAVGGTDGGTGGGPEGGTGGGRLALCSPSTVDSRSGLERCGGGFLHRSKAVACDLPGGSVSAGGAGGGPSNPLPRANDESCDHEGACHGFQLGYCELHPLSVCGPTGACKSGCLNDADCGANEICICDGTDHGGHCDRSTCRTDADCGPNSLCASRVSSSSESFSCTDPRDECRTDTECGTGRVCLQPAPDLHYRCSGIGSCGRPFLVQAEARVAPVVIDGAWSALPITPRVEHLTSAERAVLAEHWTKMGQMEHASIAAFARFQLQLLALGAPPELVDACSQALADETAHTKLCFALASAYADRKVGPGPLDIDKSLSASSLPDIVDLVILEGCFGETCAALGALELRDAASDPVIVSAYAQIAADEQRHAELAFRFVQWALSRDDGAVRRRVARAVACPPAQPNDVLTVTLPCLEALLRLPEPARAHAPASLLTT